MRRILLLLFVLSAAVPAVLRAQVGVTTDVLTGRVTRAGGAPVAGARVEAVSGESGVTRSTVTRADGRYTLTFPDGGGRYQLRVSGLGLAPSVAVAAREADEEVLVTNFTLGEQAIALEGIEARADRTPPPGRESAGGTERSLGGETVSRLPLEDNDPARLAALTPGVVAVTGADSSEARGSFSVAGQRESLNQVTLDGASFTSALTGGQAGGGSPLGIPQEGVRATQVVTSTYDVARGQFAGGQVAMTTRRGSNRAQGSVSYQLRDPALQGGAGVPEWGGSTQNRISGGIGGPIIRDRLFYYLSFQGQRRSDDLYSLVAGQDDAVRALGVSPDSVDRFLAILRDRYGLTGRTGRFQRTGDAGTGLARLDWDVSERQTITVRGNVSLYRQDNARIGFLETLENGGEVQTGGGGGQLTLTSRFGAGWINELRASVNHDRRESLPYQEIPEGRVRIASELGDGERGVATLTFGGDRALPTATRETTYEIADELSFLVRDQHRLRIGALVNASSFTQESTQERLGTFQYESLRAFAADSASRFTRSLAPRTTDGSGINAALFVGDTWRPVTRVQVTFGARAEVTRFGATPEHNPEVERVFGMRTDFVPREFHVSPRAGFSWRLNEQGAPLRLLRGGFGEFRGRAPFTLFAAAIDQTGLPTGEEQLECVGAGRVPVPNWSEYARDPSTIPTACADGSGGAATQRRANVTLFDRDFGAPRSWRASLGFQGQLRPRLTASLDLSQAWGVNLYGVRDLNLRDDAPAFVLDDEGGRPVYVPAGRIDPTGQVPSFASRRAPGFASVFALDSELGSRGSQATLGVNGQLPRRISFQTSYTWSWVRDQSSFSSGAPRGAFAQATTAGNPNRREWGRSDLERRHSVVTILGMPIGQAFEVTLIGRANSGQPFTPLVGGDVNGDGARNDRAFVFDPAATGDTALAGGMRRLLDGAGGSARDCLRSQLGRIAERNSCGGTWSGTVDLRGTARPRLPSLGRRLSVSLDVNNLFAGLDLLVNGDDPRGWGQSGVGRDATLLYPRGFDAANRRFLYEVNERFGDARTRRAGFASPFTVQLSARINVGAQQGTGAGGLAAIGNAGGGGGGFGGRGGGGGAMRVEGGGFDVDALLDRVLPDPISPILLLRDTLRLTPEQVTRVEAIRDSLRARNAPVRAEIRAAVPSGEVARPDPGEIFRRIGPRLNAGRQNVQAALAEVQRVLTPEQWRRVPAALRNPLGAAGGGGGRGGGAGGGGRPRRN